MIDPSAAFPAEARVHSSYAKMLNKRRVVRPRAQRADPQVGPLAQFLLVFIGSGLLDPPVAKRFPRGLFASGLRDIASHFVGKPLERMGTSYANQALAGAVRV